jgi:hypothetical protein
MLRDQQVELLTTTRYSNPLHFHLGRCAIVQNLTCMTVCGFASCVFATERRPYSFQDEGLSEASVTAPSLEQPQILFVDTCYGPRCDSGAE